MKKILFFVLCSLFTLGTFAQDISLSGTVTAADDGQPLPGVSVVVKGTTQGTVTDVDGNYQLEVPREAVIQFSFIGMQAQEIPVNERTEINVALESTAFDVDEVVVVGYGVQKKALTTGANVNVSGEDIAELNTGTA
ncbi:MAG: carboxypeptidase-like regulatory domain-containing protein, partial [Tangfeifania sp.]